LTREIERKVLEAFDNIHQLGVVQNDVRPENILIAQPEGSVWIVDFEFARKGDESLCETERQLVMEMMSEMRLEDFS
jgi:serine/threonine protein kinase